MQNRKLPISIQSFRDIIKNNNLYVDKTEFIYELSSRGKCYFLSRPRRFGKSLLLSTLNAFFSGEKELFQGLKINELESTWDKHPVFHIDLVSISADNSVSDSFNEKMEEILCLFEKEWNLQPRSKNFSIRFLSLIRTAYEQTGKQAVVLVDEYDKPLLESMHDKKVYGQIKGALRSFYSVFKEGDAWLRFVMLTGVTKFSGLSIFGDLNNLQDISLNERFNAICGITEKELSVNFEEARVQVQSAIY